MTEFIINDKYSIRRMEDGLSWVIEKKSDPCPKHLLAYIRTKKSKRSNSATSGSNTLPVAIKQARIDRGVPCGWFQDLKDAKEALAEILAGEAANFEELDKWINTLKKATL